MNYVYFFDPLYIRYNCAKFHRCKICVTNFRATLKMSLLNSVKNTYFEEHHARLLLMAAIV